VTFCTKCGAELQENSVCCPKCDFQTLNQFSNDSDDKLFQYLVSRVQTRETSTHAIASISSSASLVLLGLFFSDNFFGVDDTVFWIGTLAPIFGLLYFEFTFATQQTWDYSEINKIIFKESKRDKVELGKIIYGRNKIFTYPKGLLWRILLILPFIGWISVGKEVYEIVVILFCVSLSLFGLMIRVELVKKLYERKNITSLDNN
jgi:hypothetical protein